MGNCLAAPPLESADSLAATWNSLAETAASEVRLLVNTEGPGSLAAQQLSDVCVKCKAAARAALARNGAAMAKAGEGIDGDVLKMLDRLKAKHDSLRSAEQSRRVAEESARKAEIEKAIEEGDEKPGPEVQCVGACGCLVPSFQRKGIRCVRGHYQCSECLEAWAGFISQAGSIAMLRTARRGLPCPGCWSSVPQIIQNYQEPELARRLTPDVFKSFLGAVQHAAQADAMEEAQRQAAAEKARHEAAKQDGIQRHRLQVVDNILTLRCPNQHAFFDFQGCFSLSCSTCSIKFCGWCLGGATNVGYESHQHVAHCPHNPLEPEDDGAKSYYGTEAQFISTHRARQKRETKAYLAALDKAEAVAVRKALLRDLTDLGIDLN